MFFSSPGWDTESDVTACFYPANVIYWSISFSDIYFYALHLYTNISTFLLMAMENIYLRILFKIFEMQ